MSYSIKPKFFDPGVTNPMVCDECGALATFAAGWNPWGEAMRVMYRCCDHTPTRRELDALDTLLT